jgi:hypothetical protein
MTGEHTPPEPHEQGTAPTHALSGQWRAQLSFEYLDAGYTIQLGAKLAKVSSYAVVLNRPAYGSD